MNVSKEHQSGPSGSDRTKEIKLKKWIKSLVALSSLGFLTASGEPLPNLTKAVQAQKGIVAENPGDSKAYNDLGNLLTLANDREGAEQAYRYSLDLAPESVSTRFNLALLLQQTSRQKEAKEELDRLLEIEPNHGWAHYQLGVIAEADGKRSTAVESYARAFAIDPTLSFASTNPQIIDNRMATEALLLSDNFTHSTSAKTESRVPRLYDDPDRIADLMLQVLDAEDLSGDPSSESAPAADENGSGAETGGTRGGRSATGKPGRLQDGGSGGAAVGGAGGSARRESASGNAARGSAGSRTLVRVEGAAPAGDGRAATVGAPSSSRRSAASSSGRRPPGDVVGTPSRGNSRADGSRSSRGAKYRPALGSTGRLELRFEGPELEDAAVEIAESSSVDPRTGP